MADYCVGMGRDPMCVVAAECRAVCTFVTLSPIALQVVFCTHAGMVLAE